MSAACRICDLIIPIGDSAWADDWKVVEVDDTGAAMKIRTETRYVCDHCHNEQEANR